MSIGTTFNVATQVSKKVTINNVAAIKILDADSNRIGIRIELPLTASIMSGVISESEAQANALLGEPIGQDFTGNDNRYRPELTFTTETASQGEKWAFIDSTILGSLTSFDIFIIEYIG